MTKKELEKKVLELEGEIVRLKGAIVAHTYNINQVNRRIDRLITDELRNGERE